MLQHLQHLAGGLNLPRQVTTFIGRGRELVEITQILADPACRLLTLTGPGGIGKTRLAIQAGAENEDAFADGVFFVDLQPLGSDEFFVLTAMADALGLPLSGQETPQDQLIDHLSNRELLMVLDNFEHLLDVAEMLTALLRSAPRVKIITTSQVPLSLQEEWLYPVGGMPLPQPPSQPINSGQESRAVVESCESVQLFAECARRVSPDFSLAGEQNGVARICRLVEGMPLAIELAASWSKSLT